MATDSDAANVSAGEGKPSPAAPSISLPKGGGAIRGMGEKFAANPVTGTGSMTVPIAASPGRSGFGPQLSLSYDSGAGNGPFGFGWSLSLPSDHAQDRQGPAPVLRMPNESDVFILSGAEDLVPVLVRGRRSMASARQLPPRVVDGAGPIESTATARASKGCSPASSAGPTRPIPPTCTGAPSRRTTSSPCYGKDDELAASLIPPMPADIFTWLICETRDDKGNAVLYEYKAEDGHGSRPDAGA